MTTKQALLLIDAQVNMFDPQTPIQAAVALLGRLTQLLERARAAKTPVIFIRNCGGAGDVDELGTPGWEVHPALQPTVDELVLDKTTCDSFASTPLKKELDRLGVMRLTIAGLQSDFCVRETTLGALAHGFTVTLVADGHSTCDSDQQSAAEISAAINAAFRDRVTLVNADSYL
jgi:nicotinamidase-related amidase